MVRCILVGLGARGRHWLQVCQKSGLVRVVAGVEILPERRKELREKFGFPSERLFPSLKEALHRIRADFILDATPPTARLEVAEVALKAGLPVLAEKPLGVSWDAIQKLSHLVQQRGQVYMVAQNYRFNPLPRTTRRLLQEGFLGPVNTIVIGFYRPWGTRPPFTEIPYPILIDMAVHHFDLLRFILNKEPLWAWARTWNAPWGWHKSDAGHIAVFEFEGGITVTHHALGCSIGKMSPWNGEWRIEGEKGTLLWDEGGKLRYFRSYPEGEAHEETLPLDPMPFRDVYAVLQEFISALRENRLPQCHISDNIKTAAMSFSAIKSAEEKRPVALSELLKG